MKKSRGSVRKLLIALGDVQDLIGKAIADNGNDRDPHGFEKAQKYLSTAFEICINASSEYEPVMPNNGMNGDQKQRGDHSEAER